MIEKVTGFEEVLFPKNGQNKTASSTNAFANELTATTEANKPDALKEIDQKGKESGRCQGQNSTEKGAASNDGGASQEG
ncbi:MAG: hypothetical protein OQK35_02710 [Alphaproteobacteria bacterium]|nr:hypothetical protein [Alphaproteobacteria bacterium]